MRNIYLSPSFSWQIHQFVYHVKLTNSTATIFSSLIFCKCPLYFKSFYSFHEGITQLLFNYLIQRQVGDLSGIFFSSGVLTIPSWYFLTSELKYNNTGKGETLEHIIIC